MALLDQPVPPDPGVDKEILELLARQAVKALPDRQVLQVAQALLAPQVAQALLAPPAQQALQVAQALLAPPAQQAQQAQQGPQARPALPALREALVQLVIRGLKDQVGRLEIRVLPA